MHSKIDPQMQKNETGPLFCVDAQKSTQNALET